MKWKELLKELWPLKPSYDTVIREDVFEAYRDAITEIESDGALSDDLRLLEVSRWMFENGSERRQSIDSRSEILFAATAVLLTLLVGVAANLLLGSDGDLSIGEYAMLVIYALILVVLVRVGLTVLTIHGKVTRYLIGPDDLPGSSERDLAATLLRYIIRNYEVDAIRTESLYVAQRLFRNAIVLLGVAGLAIGITSIISRA